MNRFFPALMLLYLLLVGALIFRVPPGYAPDEVAHVDYVKYILEDGTLPIFKGAAPPDFGYEFHQPPFYYVVCAMFASLFAGADIFILCRVVSALFGLGTLFLVAQSVRSWWPENRQLQTMSVGLAAVWPLHLGVSASAGNDSAAGFFCAALFYLIARGAANSWTARDAFWAGLCAALGLWTKTTTLPVALVTFFAAWQLNRQGFAARWKGLTAPLTMLTIGAILAMPLFMRNLLLYGDPLGYAAFSQAAAAGTPGFSVFNSQFGVDFFTYARGVLLILFCTCWGFFGGPNSASRALKPLTPLPFPPNLILPALLCVGATIIIAFGLLRLRRGDLPPGFDFLARWFGLGALLVFLGWTQFAYQHFSGGQARYLHPALLPFCIGGALAWRAVIAEKWRGVTALIFALALLGLALMNILVWQTLV